MSKRLSNCTNREILELDHAPLNSQMICGEFNVDITISKNAVDDEQDCIDNSRIHLDHS